MLTFQRNYFCFAILIFCIEVLIALFVHDSFVRPYVGDALVVILIYCFLKAFLSLPVLTAATLVLLFSFGIESLQFLNIVKRLGLHRSKVARIIIGTSFSWIDLLCYVAGIAGIILIEKYFLKKSLKTGSRT